MKVQIQVETFQLFLEPIQPVQTTSTSTIQKYRLPSLAQANQLLGENWWYRILNKYGEFSHIVPGTFHVWLYERAPLTEFTTESEPIQIYRGYDLTVRFVKDNKTHSDLDQLISST